MINFRQKEFTEYDAMRSLYVKLMRYSDRNKFGVIDTSALIPILRGNNVVIERFVISTSMFGKDKYRMYLKIGAKAKMPDEVRLPALKVYDKRLGNMQLNISHSIFAPKDFDNQQQNNDSNGNEARLGNTNPPKNDGKSQKKFSMSDFPGSLMQKIFKGDKQYPYASGSLSPNINLSYEVQELLGEAIKYDKKSRSLVLEFKTIEDAINALNILPFGLGYKIYLLNA